MAENDFLLIDESELEDESSTISLYQELIRIVERDLDDLSPAKHGFTPWTLLAAMGAIVLIIFGIGKGVFEAHGTIVAAAFLLVHFLLQWLYVLINMTSGGDLVKPNRVYYARERLGGSIPVLAFRGLFLVFAFILSLGLWQLDWVSVVGFIGFLFLAVFYVVMSILIAKNFLGGNNRASKLGTLVWAGFLTIGYILLISAAYVKLPPPIDANFISLSVGALLAILVLILDLYLSVIAPNPVAKQLNDLRDDIVFRRLGLNEALLAYRRIREGRLFMEEVAPELAALDTKLDERFRNFETMRGIAQRIDQLLPNVDSTQEEITSALDAIAPYMDTFVLARTNVERINGELLPASQALAEKANKVQSASGDADSRQIVDAYVAGKDQYFRDEFVKLVNEGNRLDARKQELENKLESGGQLPPPSQE